MSRFFIRLTTLMLLSALSAAAVLFHRADDLSKISRKPSQALEKIDLAEGITQVVIKQSGKQLLDEGDVNHFFATRLKLRQEGLTTDLAQPQEILCDLHEAGGTLYFCWKGVRYPQPFQASMDFTVGRRGPDLVMDVTGGHYGRLWVPKVLLSPLRQALKALAAACQPELNALLSLPKLSIAKEKLVLDPSF